MHLGTVRISLYLTQVHLHIPIVLRCGALRDPLLNEMELGLSDVPIYLSRSALVDISQDVKLFCHFGARATLLILAV